MDRIVGTIIEIATKLLPAGLALGCIGVAVGLAMSVIGYRHGSDVMRTSVIGMAVLLSITVLGTYLAGKFGVSVTGI